METITNYLVRNNWQAGKKNHFHKSINEYMFAITLFSSYVVLGIKDTNDEDSKLGVFVNLNDLERLNKIIEAITNKQQK